MYVIIFKYVIIANIQIGRYALIRCCHQFLIVNIFIGQIRQDLYTLLPEAQKMNDMESSLSDITEKCQNLFGHEDGEDEVCRTNELGISLQVLHVFMF